MQVENPVSLFLSATFIGKKYILPLYKIFFCAIFSYRK